MHLTIEQLLTYLTIVVTVASLSRIVMHWLKPPLQIWIKSERFFVYYGKVEETVAYIALSLGKYARKGSDNLIVLPDKRDALNEALQNVGDEPSGDDAKTATKG